MVKFLTPYYVFKNLLTCLWFCNTFNLCIYVESDVMSRLKATKRRLLEYHFILNKNLSTEVYQTN